VTCAFPPRHALANEHPDEGGDRDEYQRIQKAQVSMLDG
jgi:hypothetical protein